MADHFTPQEWRHSLHKFQKQGGSIVWQRGRPFRRVDPEDVIRDFNYQWCYVNDTLCVPWMQQRMQQLQLTITNYLLYDYNENYSTDVILQCPEIEIHIVSSRIYHILVIPDAPNLSNPCEFVPGTNVSLLFVSFDGTDSHEILIQEADKLGMEVYMGMPAIPAMDLFPYANDITLTNQYLEFIRRVFLDYSMRFANYSSFVGAYQIMEVCIAKDAVPSLFEAYAQLKPLFTKYLPGKKFTVSPYVDFNLQHFNSSVEEHVEHFKQLARAGIDVIAIQEGRGTGNAPYFWPHQYQQQIQDVDPGLWEICQFRDASENPNVTFAEQYVASTRMAFEAFAQAQVELKEQEGIEVELWANMEAFEYRRHDPCLPVDDFGNGMAERLDRTWKSRIDWGLSFQGALVNNIISFAWDFCYLCTNGGYKQTLAEEILEDCGRPIVSGANITSDKEIAIVGFHLEGVSVQVSWTTADGVAQNITVDSYNFDPNFGRNNRKAPSLQQVTIYFDVTGADLKPKYYMDIAATSNGLQTYYPFSFYY
eukprot:TRINITY_DN3890_c0_g1_i1.p1 TRINITY_DN3890_c0_g1~~TRINITY_DN3890_c0_g1_i1.p1  ORF type:complete len:595 (+),score=73.16 TRINITY_DN3890_c0_g1_i1:181-1785(+)